MTQGGHASDITEFLELEGLFRPERAPFDDLVRFILLRGVDFSNLSDIKFKTDATFSGALSVTLNPRLEEAPASQDLSAGALDFTTSFAKDFKLSYITFHVTAAVTQTLTISIDALAGAAFDTVILTHPLSADQDFIYIPDPTLVLKSGNELRVQMSNTGTPAATVNALVSISER